MVNSVTDHALLLGDFNTLNNMANGLTYIKCNILQITTHHSVSNYFVHKMRDINIDILVYIYKTSYHGFATMYFHHIKLTSNWSYHP